MKKTNAPLNAAALFVITAFALAASAPRASAFGDVMSISELINQGSIPTNGCYVTGVSGFTPFLLENVSGGKAGGGKILIYGLTFNVEHAYILSNQLLVSGMLELAQPIPLPGTSDKTFTAESALLKFNPGGFESIDGGEIVFNLGDEGLPIGSKLSLNELRASIETTEERFGGGASLEWSLGPGKNPCDPLGESDLPIDVDLFLKSGKLESLGVGVSGLHKPLGTTGAFLDGVHGEFGFEHDLWYVAAGLLVHVGCPVDGKYLVEMDAVGTITGAWCVEIDGEATVFEIPVAEAHFLYSPPFDVSIDTRIDFLKIYIAECQFEMQGGDFSGEARGKLGIPDYIPLVGGWQMANTLAAIDNNGFQGSFTINVSPEIPPTHVSRYCPPKLPYVIFKRWSGFHRRWWQPPCTPGFTIPGFPAVSAHIGFKFRSGEFQWDEVADDQVEAWELSYRHVITDVDTGNRMWFMSNYARCDKASTGSKGRPFSKDGSGNPTATFTVPEEEENVIFRLTYQNTSAVVAMGLHLPNGDVLDVNDGPLPNGYPTNEIVSVGSYADVAIRSNSDSSNAVSFGEAYFSLPRPKAGTYTAVIYNDKALGNFALEHLRQNIPPSVALNSVVYDGVNSNAIVEYTATIPEGTPTTRIYFCKLGEDGKNKAGPRYLMAEFSSTHGINTRTIPCESTNMPAGLYRIAVTIDDPYSLAAEAISLEEFFVDNPLVPEPVSGIVALSQDEQFHIAWVPSTSTNVASYVVRYTKSQQPTDFEYQKAVSFNTAFATVDGLENGQPYLVTVVAVSTEGFQSEIGPVTRVVPSETFGLSLPSMFSPPDQMAVVGYEYTYRPKLYWAGIDDILELASQSLPPIDISEVLELVEDQFPDGVTSPHRIPISDFTVLGTTSDPHDVTNLVPSLSFALPLYWDLEGSPDGMTIDANGMVRWTPAVSNVGPHTVTIRASLTNDVAGLPVSDYSVLQTFPLTVVEEKYKNTTGLKPESHSVFLSPLTKAFGNSSYLYLPTISTNYAIDIMEGPVGMTNLSIPDLRTLQIEVDEDDYVFTFEILDLIYWAVPYDGGDNQRVRLRAAPRRLADPPEDQCVYQDFYLTISSANAPAFVLSKPLDIDELEFSPEGVGMTWWGTNNTFFIQRSTNLVDWQDIGTFPCFTNDRYDVEEYSYPYGLGIFIDTNPPPENAFYRIDGTNYLF